MSQGSSINNRNTEPNWRLLPLNLTSGSGNHRPYVTDVVETATEPASENLGQLKQDIFNFLPGTVKTDRGGAVTNTTINWDNTTLRPKHVTFTTSTPKVTTEDMVGLAAPLAAETTRVSQTVPAGSLGDQSTLINLASEFKTRSPEALCRAVAVFVLYFRCLNEFCYIL